MTDEDKNKLERHKASQRRLHSTEISLEASLFIFQMCDLFQKLASRHEAALAANKRRKRGPVDLAA